MNQEFARQYCLKAVHGGELSSAERRVLDSFLQTDVGQEYLKESNELKSHLNQIASIDLVPDPPADLKERFEALITEQIKTSRKGFWILSAILVLLCGISLVWFLLNGWSDSLIMPIIAVGCFGFCILAASASNRQILGSDDVTGQLRASRQALTTSWSRILGLALTLLPFALVIGAGYYHYGLMTAALLFTAHLILSLILIWFIFVNQRNKLRRRDSEAWDWWEGEMNS
ncbi:MAG: hypothetical protein AAF664_25005 [Planctomycetota bacterium]